MAEDLTFYRGDTYPVEYTIKDKTTGLAINITGYTFTMTVNADKDPPGTDTTNQLFTVPGSITDAGNGKVEFTPTSTNTDQEAGTYYYDVQMVDGSGNIRTVVKAKFKVTYDITKS